MRALWFGLAALAALPAAAQEGGPIRTGEHDGFTRVVMVIDPATEWSLETASGEAVIFFPGRRLDFGVADVWRRIPRTRVTGIEAAADATGTRVAVAFGCDCRISASFVGARYLALDVGDRNAPRAAVVNEPAPRDETPEARLLRETGAVASAEAALLAQITRAADQGIVVLSAPGSAPTPAGAAAEATETPPDAPQEIAAEPAPAPTAAGTADAAMPEPRPAPETIADLALVPQIEAISVYDRDSAALAALRPEPPVPPVCIADDAFDVEAWSEGGSLHSQTPALMRAVVGEFDRAEPEALRDLARLYLRFGFGAEAESLLAGFDADLEDRALLSGLARAVEGRLVAPDGPLALAVACPGRHALWLALGGRAPAFHDAAQFEAVQTAFADLPSDLRVLTGPALGARLLDADRPAEARLIYDIAVRSGSSATGALALLSARLAAAEGRPAEAAAQLRALAESGEPNAAAALAALVRLALDEGLALPERLVTDLRGAALTQRGDPAEPGLRGLLVEALATRGALSAALAEVRAAQRDLPPEAASFAALGVGALVGAGPDVPPAVFAEAALAGADLIATGPAGDPARRAIAARLTAAGLPNAALGLLAPPILRDDAASRRLAAEAYLALGEPAAAVATLDGLAGPEALRLRAAALARSGAPEAAVALLAEAGAEAEALPYAWLSGDWARARAAAGAADPARAAMAGFMAARAGAPPTGPAAAPAAPGPAAFEAPLPPLDRPSLGATRSLLAAGREITGMIGALIETE